jgi:hypothetical protein
VGNGSLKSSAIRSKSGKASNQVNNAKIRRIVLPNSRPYSLSVWLKLLVISFCDCMSFERNDKCDDIIQNRIQVAIFGDYIIDPTKVWGMTRTVDFLGTYRSLPMR